MKHILNFGRDTYHTNNTDKQYVYVYMEFISKSENLSIISKIALVYV